MVGNLSTITVGPVSAQLVMDEKPDKAKRGFATMSPERQREIAQKGGRSVPPEKRSFSISPALAAKAGKKGGQSVPREKRSFVKDRELASKAGAKGGHASGLAKEPKG